MAINFKKDETKKRPKRTLLTKLHLEHDLSVNRELYDGRSVSRMLGSLRGRWTDLILINVLLLVFAVPLLVLVFYLLPTLEKAATEGMNFSGNFGIGYPGAFNEVALGKIAIYEQRQLVLAYLIPCFPLIGAGFAGAFYCARNLLWGTHMKIRTHFWRGLAKFWWVFAICFTVLGGLAYGIGWSILEYMIIAETIGATAPAWLWVMMAGLSVLALLTLVFMIYFLSHVMCYKVKIRYHFKNSAIFSWSLLPVTLINIIVMAIPFLLGLSSFTSMMLVVIFGLFGMAFYSVWIMAIGQYGFDNFIEKTIVFKQEQEIKQIAAQKREEKKKTSSPDKNNKTQYTKKYKKKKKD